MRAKIKELRKLKIISFHIIKILLEFMFEKCKKKFCFLSPNVLPSSFPTSTAVFLPCRAQCYGHHLLESRPFQECGSPCPLCSQRRNLQKYWCPRKWVPQPSACQRCYWGWIYPGWWWRAQLLAWPGCSFEPLGGISRSIHNWNWQLRMKVQHN